MRGFRDANPGRQREYWVRSTYGIEPEAFDRMLAEQGGLCAICATAPTGQWNIDHDHSTGAVRGLLCSPCNIGIGQLHDDPVLVRAALAYLEAHVTTPTTSIVSS